MSMVKVYSLSLLLGLIGLVVVVFGGAFAESVGRADRDPGMKLGSRGKMAIGLLTGFGIGGMAAEFSPLDLTWQVSLLVALAGATLSAIWVGYSLRQLGSG